MPGTPSHPGGIYVLNWEKTKLPVQHWNEQKTAKRTICIEPSIDIVQRPKFVRPGSRSVRFDLCNDDESVGVPPHVTKRVELAATPIEPVEAKRWYAFSIYLPHPPDFAVDPNSMEILTQWHQQADDGSPPLAIGTLDGQWVISLKDWQTAGNETINLPIGAYATGQWTDWLVQVHWSDTKGLLNIWKDKIKVFEKVGEQTAYPAQGNYMKIGIYKWDWETNPAKSVTTRRIIYHDEIRIADWETVERKITDWLHPRPRNIP